jgi:hypothetical protein
MRDIIVVMNFKFSTKVQIICRDLLLLIDMITVPNLVLTSIITILIFTFGGVSAHSQCSALCLYDTSSRETKTTAARVDVRPPYPGITHSRMDGTTKPDQTPLVSDLQGESGSYHLDIPTSEWIRVSQGLSDNLAMNDVYSAERLSENPAASDYTANDSEANSNSKAPKSRNWEFTLVPYGWFTSISEDIVVNGQGASGHATFIDLLEHLDIAGMLHGEVWWKGRIGIYSDTIYSKLALNKDVALRRLGSISAGLQTSFFIQEFGALYRVGTWPVGSPYNQFVQRSKPSFTFNILAGGRYWHLKNELDVRGPLGILSKQIDQSQNWFDFIVGGRARLEFYKKLFLEVTTDIGGFDISFSSKFSWNVLAVLGYELSWHRITPLIGFRALYDNYANGSGNSRFDSKMWMYGPALGVAFKF